MASKVPLLSSGGSYDHIIVEFIAREMISLHPSQALFRG